MEETKRHPKLKKNPDGLIYELLDEHSHRQWHVCINRVT